ncbi:MAG: aminoacyl-tRNA deacylase [Ilumatobacteraceae bacterium]|nr:aminoacyl-tRNA deacylase [Ilumatobacteraceae bacterium]
MASDKGRAGDKNKGGTPATVLLTQAGVDFRIHEFEHDPSERNYGAVAAAALAADPDQVFKTLLAQVEGQASAPGVPPASIAVGIVPVSGQLSLKELATAVGAKRAEMCDPVVAERITGYVVGGISPFGQKKALPTAIDETCLLYDTIFVSGGKRGFDIEIAPADLIAVLHAVVAPIGVSR